MPAAVIVAVSVSAAEPLPTDALAFKARIDEGRARLNLIAAEPEFVALDRVRFVDLDVSITPYAEVGSLLDQLEAPADLEDLAVVQAAAVALAAVTAAIARPCGLVNNCTPMALSAAPSTPAFETSIPAATETTSAGICETMPSPTVSKV